MQVPETVSRNTIAVYAPKNNQSIRRLDGEDLCEWRKAVPQRLNEISMESIATNWEENPILEELTLDQDGRLLLDVLSTDLPLELTVAKIDDEIYWRRCYCARWPNKLPVPKPKTDLEEKARRSSRTIQEEDCKSAVILEDDDVNERPEGSLASKTSPKAETGGGSREGSEMGEGQVGPTWKRCYLEMHIQEALENLKPEDYNPHQIKSLVDLCRGYVRSLKIHQMLAPTFNPGPLDRVPLKSIISGLPLLTELKICYKQTYAGDNFNWHVMQTTLNDIRSLSIGLKNCNLTSFSIVNSDVDCDKFILLARSLLTHPRLRMLDFSHCNISDRGAAAFGRLIRESPALASINLTNNSITGVGAEILAYAVSHFENRLSTLYLGLNKVGVAGGNFLAAAMLLPEKCTVENLMLPGCGLTPDSLPLVEVLKFNEKLKVLDLSNNRMGEDVGDRILEMLEWNSTLEKIDVRMCGLSPAAIFAVQDKIILKNRKPCGDALPDLPKFGEENILARIEAVFSEAEELPEDQEEEEEDEGVEEDDAQVELAGCEENSPGEGDVEKDG